MPYFHILSPIKDDAKKRNSPTKWIPTVSMRQQISMVSVFYSEGVHVPVFVFYDFSTCTFWSYHPILDRDTVLFGRGKPSQKHPGNLRLAKLIEERQVEYHQADKTRKVKLSWEIVKLVREDKGGRFLEKDDSTGEWYVCLFV